MLLKSILPGRNAAGAIMATAFLYSCGSSSITPKDPPQMHLACQTVECECRGKRADIFSDRQVTDIVWQRNGDATCPKGFTLKRVRLDFLGRRK
tara:strand:+ start:223 stop:504 length:282 start_codon:yes stop_codon:yes gene_type:complete